MDRYSKENAGHIIDGYFIPSSSDSDGEAFCRAKKEAVKNMENLIALVEGMDEETFKSLKKHI